MWHHRDDHRVAFFRLSLGPTQAQNYWGDRKRASDARTAVLIEQILKGEDLAEASTWADEERSGAVIFW